MKIENTVFRLRTEETPTGLMQYRNFLPSVQEQLVSSAILGC
jgi:hypothetical protein